MKLYDPSFLPEESDDLLDFFDLTEECEDSTPPSFKMPLIDVAYEQGMGEFQLRELVSRSADGKTIALQGRTLRFQKDSDGGYWFN